MVPLPYGLSDVVKVLGCNACSAYWEFTLLGPDPTAPEGTPVNEARRLHWARKGANMTGFVLRVHPHAATGERIMAPAFQPEFLEFEDLQTLVDGYASGAPLSTFALGRVGWVTCI